jgi:hypothetical protein
MVKTTKLASYEGRLAETSENSSQLLWMSDKDKLGETVESVMAKLLELKNNPYGIPLQRMLEDDTKPNLEDTTLVDIQDVYIEDSTQDIVVTLNVKKQQTPVGVDEQVSEELVDESVEDTFPASDPPALKSTSS